MVEELEKTEKQARKARRKTRMLYVLISLDVILLGYVVFEIISLVISLTK